MTNDNILKIWIDNDGRLCIQPAKEKFTMVYRSAAEVHWDNTSDFLFSPRPREWSYLDWYKHIVSLVIVDYNCRLLITNETDWLSVPAELKENILEFDKNYVV